MAMTSSPEMQKVMRDIYPEYGPYMDARAKGIDHEDAWLIAQAVAAKQVDPERALGNE